MLRRVCALTNVAKPQPFSLNHHHSLFLASSSLLFSLPRSVASSHNKHRTWGSKAKQGLNKSASQTTYSPTGQQKLEDAFKEFDAVASSSSSSSSVQQANNNASPTKQMTARKIIEFSMNPENDMHYSKKSKSLAKKVRGVPQPSSWWTDTTVLRKNRFARLNSGIGVVGGSDAIKSILKNDKCAQPRCVFVPDDEPTPQWLLLQEQTSNNQNQNQQQQQHPIVIVRAPRSRINHDLLSAEKCDGYAAQVYLPSRLPREFAFVAPEKNEKKLLKRVTVCHGLRIPSNVGGIIKSAYKSGYDGIVLDRCCELSAEKVLRAAGDAALDPNFHIFEFGHKLIEKQQLRQKTENSEQQQQQQENVSEAEKDFAEGASSGLLLKRIAAAHNLLPMMMIPSANTPFASSEEVGVYDIMTVARQFHYTKYMNKKMKINMKNDDSNKSDEGMGTMLVVGSEAQGLSGLASEWNRDALFVPLVPITLKIDHPFINSVNVAASAAATMHYFRPNAEKEFEEYFKRGIVPDDDGGNNQNDDEDENDAELEATRRLKRLTDERYVVPALKEAKDFSERLLK